MFNYHDPEQVTALYDERLRRAQEERLARHVEESQRQQSSLRMGTLEVLWRPLRALIGALRQHGLASPTQTWENAYGTPNRIP